MANGAKKQVIQVPGAGGSSTFLGLSDTPDLYTGQALKGTRVNAGETALEFFTLGGGTGTVTSVSSTTADATVANPTTTPAITIVSAPKLTTARTINGVAFDGTANITVADATKEPTITAGTTAQYYRGDKTMQTLDKTTVGLGNVDNTSDVNKPVSTATQTAINNATIGLLDDRGNYSASTNVFPSAGGSGTAGAVLKGDLWTISVAGILGGVAVTAGDVVRCLVDTPGQIATNWAISENNIGYVAENQANKDNTTTLGTSTTLYPTQNAVKVYADTGLATKQALDAGLTSLSALTGAGYIKETATDTFSLVTTIPNTDITGLGTLSTQSGTFTAIPQANVVNLVTDLSSKEATANKDASGGYVGLTLFKINFKNVANTITSFFTNTNTVARTYTYQDRDGTISDNTDLALKAPLASPTFTGTVVLPASQILTTPVINGIPTGTGVSSSNVGNTLVLRQASGYSMSNNNITVSGATATAGGTTAISGNSFGKQLFTGTLNQTVTLPGGGGIYQGTEYEIVNQSTGIITVQTATAVFLIAIPSGASALFTSIVNTDLATSWSIKKEIVLTTTGSGAATLVGETLNIPTPSAGTGTVTSFSVTTANGVSGSVATPTTTPAITLTLGAITPTTIVASGNTQSPKIGVNVANGGTAMIEILNSLALQGLRIENDLATRIAFSTFVTADGFVRFTFLGNGRQEWGNGTALADTNLYRSAVGTLTTDGKIEALTGIKLTNSSTVGHIWKATDIVGNGSWQANTVGITQSIQSIATNTTGGTTASTNYIYNCTAALTFTLPTAVGNTNNYTVNRVSGLTTVATTASQTILGSSTARLPINDMSLTFVSDGANWKII